MIQKIAAYDGVFLEDGTDEEITGVAAMVLENTGETAVEYTRISLNAGGETWSFEATAIPAGQTVVVQEADRAAYRDAVLTGCTADVAELEAMEMSEDQVRVTDNGDNSLTVTNLTQEPIVCVRVFYKYYMEDLDVYVGGIAYTAKVTDLQPGEEVQIIPSHYAAGSSRIVMVRTYDTE